MPGCVTICVVEFPLKGLFQTIKALSLQITVSSAGLLKHTIFVGGSATK